MGVVYKARHRKLNRPVALKVIRGGALAGAEQLRRFITEAEAIARLQHPNIVQIYDVGEHDGLPYIALELVEGGSLAERLSGALPPAPEAARLVGVLARAVQYAHQRGVVHRDLKPANVLLAEDGTPKVADFGLAKRLDEAGETVSGAILGTPSYMAPEQARGQAAAVGPAADVYALGAVLYALLTGRPPFQGATPLDTLRKVEFDAPVPPAARNPAVPDDLEAVCLKCLRKEPGGRYATAEALADDLRRFQAGEPVEARPVGGPERAAKWVRRRPAVAVLLALVAAWLVAGTTVSTYFAIVADRRAAQAEESARIAREEREAAEKALERARESERLAREKEQAADAALGQTEPLLAEGLLRPIGHQYRYALNPIELSALWELATLPKERERVRLLFIERAVARLDTAEQLARGAVPAAHAVVGLDRGRRERVLNVLRSPLRVPQTDLRIRTACGLVVAALSPPDEDSANEAAQAICKALKTTTDIYTARALADGLAAVADRIGSKETEAATLELSVTVNRIHDDGVRVACGNALVVLLRRLDRVAAGRDVAAVTFQRLSRQLAMVPKNNPAHHALARALRALPGKPWEELARRFATEEAAKYLNSLLLENDAAGQVTWATYVAALLDSLEEREARRDADRAVARLLAIPFQALGPLDRQNRARTLVALLDHLEEAEAHKAAATALGPLLSDLLAPKDLNQQGASAGALVLLAAAVGPEDAASAATQALDVLTRPGDSPGQVHLAAVVAALASRLSPEEAKKAGPRVIDALLLAPDAITRQRLTAALTALADRLTKDDADRAAREVFALLRAAGSGDGQEVLALALAALAGRLEPEQARDLCDRAVEQLLKDVARTEWSAFQHVTVARGVGALAGRLEEGHARRAAESAAAQLRKDMDKNVTSGERAHLARGLTPVAGLLSPAEAAATTAKVLGTLPQCDPGTAECAACADALAALAPRLEREEAAAAAGQLLDTLGRADLPLEQEHLLAALEALTAGLDCQALVNLLKHPACVRQARSVILRRCERLLKQPFADLWQLIDWLAANDAAIDVVTPPRLPAPR